MQTQIGKIYWLKINSSVAHPHVVINYDPEGETASVCAITTNANKLTMPGNVVLAAGVGSLSKESFAEVGKVYTVATSELKEYIGNVSPEVVIQIQAGVDFINKAFRRGGL